MGKVVTSASISLDGYISGPGESGFEHLFGWHNNGDVEVSAADPRWSFTTTEPSAAHLREQMAATGALVVGRRLFDVTQGWGGNHPFGVPIFVVTHHEPRDWDHPEAPFTFVTDGVESAVARAREVAGGKDVGVAAGTMARQALAAGLVDEIWVDLVPVLLGGGTPFFDTLAEAPVVLGTPRVIETEGVTHLRYRVGKGRGVTPGVEQAGLVDPRWRAACAGPDGAGARLMGATTYAVNAAHWPGDSGPFAKPMNEIPKVVFSDSLASAERGRPGGAPRRSREGRSS